MPDDVGTEMGKSMTVKNIRLGEIMPLAPWKRFVALLGLVVFVNGCTHVPTQEEMAQDREKNARTDVELIKPAMSYGNFGEKPLTLEDCINYALENNLEVRIAKLNEEIQDKQTLMEKLNMLPSLKADASWRRRDKLRKSDAYNWLTDQDEKDYTVSELKENSWANLVLTWDVLDTMMAYVRSGISEMHEEVLKQERVRQSQQLALDVTQAYWHAAAVEDALDFVHDIERELIDVKSRLDQAVSAGSYDGMAARDVEMRLKELEMTIRQLQANLSKERLELARLMGLNQNVQFTLARPPLKPIIGALPHTKELNIDRLEEYALLHRPELFVNDMKVRIQMEEVKNKVLSMFPGVNVFAGTHYDSNRLLHASTWNSIGAGVGWELLDLPAKFAAYKGQEKSVEMAKTQRLMTTVGVITQVHIALLDYAIKVDRFRLLDETYALAKDLFQMAREKHSAGQLPELAVTQRRLEEMAAKLRRDEAVVDLLVAHKRLCVSIGKAPLDCDREGLMNGRGALGAATSYPSGSSTSATYPASSNSGTSGYEYTETPPVTKWRCQDCGYVHVGPQPPTACPICGAPSSRFVLIPQDERTNVSNIPLSTPGPGGTRAVVPPTTVSGAADPYLWKVQVGAFVDQGGPTKRIDEIHRLLAKLSASENRVMDNRDAVITTERLNGRLYNRVRVLGLTQGQAEALRSELQRNGMEYWVIPPGNAHW